MIAEPSRQIYIAMYCWHLLTCVYSTLYPWSERIAAIVAVIEHGGSSEVPTSDGTSEQGRRKYLSNVIERLEKRRGPEVP